MSKPSGTFPLMYPRASALGLEVIDAGPGFDALELEGVLGPDRFKQLMAFVTEHGSLFCCNHRHYPLGHELGPTDTQPGYEVHCCYVKDVEKFLEQEAA